MILGDAGSKPSAVSSIRFVNQASLSSNRRSLFVPAARLQEKAASRYEGPQRPHTEKDPTSWFEGPRAGWIPETRGLGRLLTASFVVVWVPSDRGLMAVFEAQDFKMA